MPKKVLFVASVVKMHINQFHLPYIKWFGERGYEVHVCAADDFGEEELFIPGCDGFFDVPFSRSPLSPVNLKAYFMLKELMEREEYEIICCNTPIPSALVRLAAAKVRRKGTKVIYTAHGFHFYKGAPPVSRVYYAVEKTLAGRTDAIITINGEDLAAAEKFCVGRGCRCFMVHGLGVDISRIRSEKAGSENCRSEFGIPKDAFLLMTTAEINKNKNISAAITAFAKVCKEHMYYLICGTGKMADECKALSQRLGVGDKVIFAGYRYDVYRLLHTADAFIFPSRREGLGLAAIEAMAAGLPVIVSDNRGTREFAVNGENSIVCGPDDIDAFAAAISALEENDGLRQRLGSAAAESVMKYDVHNSVNEITEILKLYTGSDQTLETAEKESVML